MINEDSSIWYAIQYDCPEYKDLHGRLHETSAGIKTTDCPYCVTFKDAGYSCPQLLKSLPVAEHIAAILVKRDGRLIDVHPKVVKVKIIEVNK